jgi:heavy metal sensor kinase
VRNSSTRSGASAMLFDKLRSLRRTLAFRLTLWYAAIFTVSSVLAFFFFYLQIASILRERTDQELLDDIEEFAGLLEAKGLEDVKQTMVLEANEDGVKEVFYRLLTPDGRESASSDLFFWGELPVNQPALQQIAAGAKPVFETLTIEGRRHKARAAYGSIGPDTILQIGLSLEDNDEFLAQFREIFGVTVPGVMVLACLFGWFMAKRALGSVEEVTRTARFISAGDLQQRVPVTGRAEEIDRLAITFNDMLDRIQKLITEMKEMTENIAHDLRSPITRIRGVAEMSLTTGKAIDEYEAAAGNTVEECDRLLEMINTMLYISRAEARAERLSTEEVNMAGVIRDACELFRPVTEDKRVSLVSDVGTDLRVRGELQDLQRMIANLIDNAVNYTPPRGVVTVSGQRNHKLVIIRVEDTGIGISAHEIPLIFRRFYRCDRSRSQPGVGLGLSLVQAIVQAHRGEISVSSAPNVGTTFTVTLPSTNQAS